MVPSEHISKISTRTLVDKIGSHLSTGFLHDLSNRDTESINKEINSLDFFVDPKTRMQVFEKIGASYYGSDEEMQASFDQGISGIQFINNPLGLELAKKECLKHFLSYVRNTIYRNEVRLRNLKSGCPVFLLNKDRKEKYKRLTKKVEIMEAIAKEDAELLAQYDPTQDVYRLDLDKELRIITPLPEEQDFFFVDTNKISITKVRHVITGYRDYFIDQDNIDGYLDYTFIDEDNKEVYHCSIKDTDYLETGEIHVNIANRYLFSNKSDALNLLKREKDRINKAIDNVT